MQGLRSSVEDVMKLTPFQGMIDQSIVTNKMFMSMNTNIGNLASEIKNAFKINSVQQVNRELAETQQPINNIQQGLDSIRKSLISVGDIDTAKKVKEYEYELLNAKEVNSTLNQQISATKNLIAETYDIEEVEKFKNALNFEDTTYTLTEKLKEVESQLRACGETAKANKIKEYMQETQKKTIDVDSSINELKADIEKCFGTEAVNDFNNKLNETNNKLKNISRKSSFSTNLKTALGIGTVALGIRKTIGFFKDATNESVDFVEQQNLFNVSMGKTVDQYGILDKEASKYYTKAIAFQETLEEKLGVNISESMQYQALFNAMSKSMGIASDKAYLLSENFTKLGYDLSSLYNIDPENAMQKLRAGLSGQTKPLRDLDLDITQQSLEPLLDQLGIERSVKQLSQAEKMIARYIVVLRQASLAHGDFAKTMDSPANQLRIFNAQLTAFKRNTANLWQGLLGQILPYVNAIMMVINELLKMVAKLFGFKVSDQSTNISTSIGADDLADDLGTATGKAKELKKQLMGFDEINNIDTNKNKNGSSGASVGGIDQRLLDAMKEYDNLMSKVKNKAKEISDKILKWLGFTKDINGNLKWSWDNMNSIAKLITIIAGVVGGIFVLGKLVKLVNWLKTLKGVLVGTKDPITTFQSGLSLIGIGFRGTIKWVKDGIKTFKECYNNTKKFGTSLKETSKSMFDAIPNTVKLGVGIAGLTASSILAYKSMKDLSEGTIGTKEAILKLTGSIVGATASGALIGSVFGPAGTVIGALTGLLISGASAFAGWKTDAQLAMEQTKDFNKSIEDSYNTMLENNKKVQEYGNNINTEVDKVERLKSKLSELVDENGKVKKGYEDRAEFILGQLNNALGTEFTLNDLIKGKYNEIIETIDKVIEKKKQEAILTVFEEKYTQAMKDRVVALQNVEETTNNLNNALSDVKKNKYEQDILKLYDSWNNLSEAEKNAQGNFSDYAKSIKNKAFWLDISEPLKKETSSIIDNLSTQDKAFRENSAIVKQYSQDIVNYNQALTLSEKGKTTELALLYDEQVFNVNEAGEQILTSHKNTIRGIGEGIKEYELILQYGTEAQRKSAQEEIKIEEDKLREIGKSLKGQAVTIEEMTPEIVEDWKQMAISSKKVYDEQISTLPADTKEFLQLTNGEIDIISPEMINRFQKMASESNQKYNKILSILPTNTAEKVQLAINEVNAKQNSMNIAGSNLAKEGIEGADSKVKDNNTGIASVGNWFVQGFLNALTGGHYSVWKAGFDLVKQAIFGGNEAQKTGSPAKETIKMGNFFTEGYIIGLKKKQEEVRKISSNLVGTALKELNKFDNTGFSVNPNDFKIDTNEFIDYGQISGEIATQSNVKIDSNLDSRIENAIYRGLSNATIPVEIEAKTDEGIVFKKVQAKAKEYLMQTGEPAFDF